MSYIIPEFDIKNSLKNAKIIAKKYVKAYKRDYDDCFSDANYGIALAVRDYNPTKKANFNTYAMCRVEGNIKDGLRKDGIVWTRIKNKPFILLYDDLSSVATTNDSFLEKIEQRKYIATILSILTDKEREIIFDRFYIGLSPKDFERKYKVTESRISQIVNNAFKKIRKRFNVV